MATVVAYSRGGHERSAPGPAPRDGRRLVAELRRMLEELQVVGPHILVGHSYGAQLVLLHARTHPQDVAGLVLVEGRPPAFTRRCLEALGRDTCQPEDALVAQLPAATRDELQAADSTVAQLEEAPGLPPLPAIVLTGAGPEGTPEFFGLWQTMQQELAKELKARHRIILSSGHALQREAPGEVEAAARELLGRR